MALYLADEGRPNVPPKSASPDSGPAAEHLVKAQKRLQVFGSTAPQTPSAISLWGTMKGSALGVPH